MSADTPIDPLWLAEQVNLYADEQKVFQTYADTLLKILKAACNHYALLGICQARPKSVSSFAEKAARKASKYQRPVEQLTDLCGARIILHTHDQVQTICRFIREHFIIDEANSEDKFNLLRDSEFGYQSVHFVVQMKSSPVLGVNVPLDIIGNRKAEIQVRTLCQHAWADITHDRLYKSQFRVPQELRRLAHRIAALLENADDAFNQFERSMQAYLGNYTAYMKPEDLQREITILGHVLKLERETENRPAIALRLARLASAAGQTQLAVETLKDYRDVQGPLRLPILVELGTALMQLHRHAPDADACRTAEQFLAEAADLAAAEPAPCNSRHEQKLKAAAAAALALAHDQADQSAQARTAYARSQDLDPDDPYTFCAQLTFGLTHTQNPAIVDSARSSILRAIAICRSHVNAGLQLPRAWFTMGRLCTLLGRYYDALDNYAKAIRFILAGADRWPQEALDAELEFLRRTSYNDASVSRRDWILRMLRMAWWLKNGRPGSVGQAVGLPVACKDLADQPILLVAGGTLADLESQLASYRNLLYRAVEGFDGIVISGGTTAGIPGQLGRIALELRRFGRKRFRLIGYHPELLPKDATPDEEGYNRLVSSGGHNFSAAEPLQTWLDLLAAGVDPARVRLLGINGGRISRFEYALALALGARVGLIQSSGRAADEFLRDPDWSRQKQLLSLPLDPMTAKCFVHLGAHHVPDDRLTPMAQLVHQLYRHGMRPDYRRPNTLPWEALPEDLQQSSRDQAASTLWMLRDRGYRVDATDHPVKSNPPLRPEDIPALAELEHGRWTVERLASGWRYGSTRSDDNKLSPYLKPWSELPHDIQQRDAQAVSHFPQILAAGRYILSHPTQAVSTST